MPPYTMQPAAPFELVHCAVWFALYTSDPTAEHAPATRCHSASCSASPTTGGGAPDAGMQKVEHEIFVSPGASTCSSIPAHVSVHVAPPSA